MRHLLGGGALGVRGVRHPADPAHQPAHPPGHVAGQGLHVARVRLRPLRQGAHLVGDDREAPPLAPRPFRLDGGVQGEETGLVGALHDQGGDLADVGRLALKPSHRGRRLTLADRVGAHLLRRTRNAPARLRQQQLERLALVQRDVGGAARLGEGAGAPAGNGAGPQT